MSHRSLFACFTGISAYANAPLSGCVKDMLDMDLLLRELCAQQEDPVKYEPFYLLEPNITDKDRITEHETLIKEKLDYKSPTYQNFITLPFEHLDKAKDGDICVFCYSGHGSQTDAPEEFWHTKPDRKNETIVCVDSRDLSTDARDVIDKELGYLFWNVLKEKKVHCLVIMDCCHAGNNMRNIDDSPITYRFIPSAKNKVPLTGYLGYKEGFYKIKNNKASIDIARYVQLAACSSSEKAVDSPHGGLFTSKLVNVLRGGGTARSYRDLMQNLSVSVRNKAEQQNPEAFAVNENDLDLQFLGGKIIPYQPSFEVRYHHGFKKWILYGGQIHGIPSIEGKVTAIARIEGTDKDIDVTEVHPDTSFLDETQMQEFVITENYKAHITWLANPPMKIGLSAGLAADKKMRDALEAAIGSEKHLYFKIDLTDNADAEYLVQLTEDDKYVLTRVKSQAPLFKREKDASSFLRSVDTIGKWIATSELKSGSSAFSTDDFIFTFEKLEGISFKGVADVDGVPGESSAVLPGSELLLKYKYNAAVNTSLKPAFRLSIAINPKSRLQECYIDALYLDSMFGIQAHMINGSAHTKLVKNGEAASFMVKKSGVPVKTVPIMIDERYQKDYNINEISSFIKVFISDKPFNLERYQQPELKLDDQPNVQMRGDLGWGDQGDNNGWAVFSFKLRITGPDKQQTITTGNSDFSAFTVTAPEGFAATAWAITGDDQQASLQQRTTKNIDDPLHIAPAFITPPSHIWGDAITSDFPFTKGLNSASDNAIQALELLPVKENENIVITEGNELLIKPKQTSNTRSIDEMDETIIPYGFDEASQLFIPLGYTDETGIIHINRLPSPTPGLLHFAGPQTRSLGSSIKLFFKKIFRQKNLQVLVLYKLNEKKEWEKTDLAPSAMKALLQQSPGAKAILLVHGIIGDTRGMIDCFCRMEEIKNDISYILTFDYENLSTSIEKTAVKLHEILHEAGFNDAANPQLTVVAHSMGGLVMRWMIEKHLKPVQQLTHLVMAGTPNAGSELAGLKRSVSSLLTHALNVTGPAKYAITGLSFLLKKIGLNPLHTLEELGNGSDLITQINASKDRLPVRYSGICGDVSLLAKGYDGDDHFLKKIADMLMKKIAYPGLTHLVFDTKPNDMAVTIESMETVHGFTPPFDAAIVPCNHISYFSEKESSSQLLSLILASTTNNAGAVAASTMQTRSIVTTHSKKQTMAKGISLHIGLNKLDTDHYKDVPELNAAVRDAIFWQQFAEKTGYTTHSLHDEEATVENVRKIITGAKDQLNPGDILFITYSGHGGEMLNDKEAGFQDEKIDQTWCLYNRQWLDDEIYECFRLFPKGIRIVVVSDSCHSGTVTRVGDLDITAMLGNGLKDAGTARGFRSKKLPKDTMDYIGYKFRDAVYKDIMKKYSTTPQGDDINASVKLLAACQDDQVTFDGQHNGIFTEAFIDILNDPQYKDATAEMMITAVCNQYSYPRPNFFEYGSIIPSFDYSFPFAIDIPDATVIKGHRKPQLPASPASRTIRLETEQWDTLEFSQPAVLLIEVEGKFAGEISAGAEAIILEQKNTHGYEQLKIEFPSIPSEHAWTAAHALQTELTKAGYTAIVEPIVTVNPAQREKVSREGDASNPDYIKEWPPSMQQGKVLIGWHLDDEHSQLMSAHEHIMKEKPDAKIRIAHFDTGYIEKHEALPKQLATGLARSFVDKGNPNQAIDKTASGQDGHGLGTLTLLAGNEVSLKSTFDEFKGYIGGIPFAEVVPVRISESVVIFNSENFCDAIDYAIEQNCEVVSMSMAGKPGKRMARAVNRAYEAGIVLVTAASNCWYKGPGVILPKCVLFPAAFERVIAATGAMHNHEPYDVRFLQTGRFNIGTKYMQGSWGPASRMKKALAAYTPNVPWATVKIPFVRSGGGTSSATPQVAAAAALWIAFHRDKLVEKGYYTEGNQWKKVEAVRHALFNSAAKDNAFPEWKKYYGNGILRARKALDIDVPDESLLTKSEEAESSIWGVLELIGSFFKRRRLFRSTLPKPPEEALAIELLQLLQTDPQFYALFSELDLESPAAVLSLVESDEFRMKVLGSSYASPYLKEAMMG